MFIPDQTVRIQRTANLCTLLRKIGTERIHVHAMIKQIASVCRDLHYFRTICRAVRIVRSRRAAFPAAVCRCLPVPVIHIQGSVRSVSAPIICYPVCSVSDSVLHHPVRPASGILRAVLRPQTFASLLGICQKADSYDRAADSRRDQYPERRLFIMKNTFHPLTNAHFAKRNRTRCDPHAADTARKQRG